ncbi:MAG TPA: hypothetical protein VJ959_07520 [Desulfotignum sp.]|nr:hypothetical protein [Desulfotignum sp.]
MEKNISFRVSHQCPQCGAPIVLDEDTLFFVCEYCRVKSCICQQGFPRYMFSRSSAAMAHPGAPDDDDLLYIPYWRFKGVRYTCNAPGVTHKFLDLSALALEESSLNLPFSLGFRSQALALKQITPETRGRFLRPADAKTVLGRTQQSRSRMQGKSVSGFTEDIGETRSLIYSPFYAKDGILVDAILNCPTGSVPESDRNLQSLPVCRPEKQTVFVPGLCPACGWDLEGSRDSLVLVCRNCHSLWKARDRHLARVRFACARPGNDTDVMVPFWKISARIFSFSLSSYADLVRLGNLPRALKPEWENQSLFFWAPAFKIRPRIFLRLATQLTACQPDQALDKKICTQTHVPVTLPAAEAVQSIRILLAGLSKPLNDHLPALSQMQIEPVHAMLVYLAFEEQLHDYVHPEIQAAINKNALALSSNL